jgi:hypothetical protein
MEAVMLLEVLDDHRHVQLRRHVRGAGGQCRIGRSVGCDLTVHDPFVAAEHVVLTLKEDGRVHVQDLGSRNGTYVDDRLIDPGFGRMIAGGELVIGRTRVRVRTADAKLEPERPLRRDLLLRHRTQLAVTGVVLCLAFAALLQWMYAPAQLAQRVLIAELAAAAALAVWVGTWALVSRLTVGAWRVRIHLSIAAFCLALWAWGYGLYSVGAFALQWRWLAPVMIGLAAVVAFVAAWLHLRNATHLRQLAAVLLAFGAPLLCGGLWWALDLQLDPRTVNRVEQGPRVYPPALRIAPSVDLNDYLADLAGLKRDASRNRQQSLLENPILDEEDAGR